jgi:uncharacterized membrane protein
MAHSSAADHPADLASAPSPELSASPALSEVPAVRRIGPADIAEALRRGFDDFKAMPSHVVFVSLIYPIAGVVLAGLTFGYNVLPLLYPLASGFALLGPLAALGLYEMSRRREAGLDTSWTHVRDVLRSPAIGSIALLGLVLLVIFVAWLMTAQALYHAVYGWHAPESLPAFLSEVLTTRRGWRLILLGNAIGAVFAVAAFAISVVSFPLMLDRNLGMVAAVLTSVRAVIANPGTMALWGLTVAVLLGLGSLPAFVGLAIVMPLLGHATWHLYRRVVQVVR